MRGWGWKLMFSHMISYSLCKLLQAGLWYNIVLLLDTIRDHFVSSLLLSLRVKETFIVGGEWKELTFILYKTFSSQLFSLTELVDDIKAEVSIGFENFNEIFKSRRTHQNIFKFLLQIASRIFFILNLITK